MKRDGISITNLHKLVEVDFAALIEVKRVNNAADERVVLQLRKSQELLSAEGARLVRIKVLETSKKALDLLRSEASLKLGLLDRAGGLGGLVAHLLAERGV